MRNTIRDPPAQKNFKWHFWHFEYDAPLDRETHPLYNAYQNYHSISIM